MQKKLSEIETAIKKELSTINIDEFYQDSSLQFVREIFAKETHASQEEEINYYLTKRFPETTSDGLKFSLNQSLGKLNEEKAGYEKILEEVQREIDKNETALKNLKEKQGQIPNQEAICKAELDEIDKELVTINGFKDNKPYSRRISELEKAKGVKTKELQGYPQSLDALEEQITDQLKEVKKAKDEITKMEKLIAEIDKSVAQKGVEIEALKQKEDSHFKLEYAALEFLFKVLLRKDINKRNLTKWNGSIAVETGEVELISHQVIAIKDHYKFITSFAQNNPVIPKGWRKYLHDLLCKPLPAISGIIKFPDAENQSSFFEPNLRKLSAIDTSHLLALKNASRMGQSVKTTDKEIILALSGGLSAKLIFRERNTKKAEGAQFNLYVNFLDFTINRGLGGRIENIIFFTEKSLYYQRGYADSVVNIDTPGAYYIVTDEYVIEIYFEAAPVLLDLVSVAKLTPNISGLARQQYESDEEERLRKKKEDDDYYYRYYDDDDD